MNNPGLGRILVVDDEIELMTIISEILTRQGYHAEGYSSGREAIQRLKESEFDLLLTDLMMPEMSGIEVIKTALEIDPHLVGIIMTGHGTIQTAIEAMKIGAFDYLLKPFKLDTLLPSISRAMGVRGLKRENIELRGTLALYELTKAVTFSVDLTTVANKVADAAIEQTHADEASVMLPTEDGNELYVVAARGPGREYILGQRVKFGQGIAGWVADHHELLSLEGDVADPRFQPEYPRPEIRMAMSVPMMASGKFVGVLNVNTINRHSFTVGQIKALTIAVSMAAPSIQNAGLFRMLREAEQKYRGIFENAVEGIFQITPSGRLITANPSLARIAGYDSTEEVMADVADVSTQLYANPEVHGLLIRDLGEQDTVLGLETQIRRRDGGLIWVSMNLCAIRDRSGRFLCYEGAMEDITLQKKAEARQVLYTKVLEILNLPIDKVNLIHDILALVKQHTGIEAVAVRLKEGKDFPYFEVDGFSDTFVRAEQHLIDGKEGKEKLSRGDGTSCLGCLCGDVLEGRTDPSLHYFSRGGSFWTNSTSQFLTAASRRNGGSFMRNGCNTFGYESVALIPLRSGDETIGLLQLNDRRPDRFSLEKVEFLEGLGASIGVVVARKEAEEAVRRSEEKFRSLYESMDELVALHEIVTDGDGVPVDYRLFDCNPSFTRMTGIARERTIGSLASELYGTGRAPYLDRYARVVETGTPDNFETYYLPTGKYLAMSVFSPYEGCFAWVASDITEQKVSEKLLKESEERYRSIFENAVEGIFQATSEGRFITVNPAMARMHGFASPEEMIAGVKNIGGQLFTNDEERKRYSRLLAEHGSIHSFEAQICKNDGSVIWASINARAVKGPAGEMLYIEGTAEDITHRKEAELRLKEAFEFQQHLIDALPVPVFYKDGEGRYMGCNSAYEKFIGRRREEVVGKSVYEITDREYADIYHGWDLALMQNPGIRTFDSQVKSDDGVIHDVIFHKATFPDRDCSVGGVIGAVLDITQRKRAEMELNEAMVRLKKSLIGTIQATSLMVEIRDPYTAGHQRRVSSLAASIAQEMGLPEDTVDCIRMAATIHDVGKMSVPAEILSKPGRLTDLEMGLIRIHSQAGYDILKDSELPHLMAEIVWQHHERLDGSGYPQGLKGDQISLEALIVAVADVVEAIASHRPYRPACGVHKALEEIEQNKGVFYSPEAVEACLRLFEGGFRLE